MSFLLFLVSVFISSVPTASHCSCLVSCSVKANTIFFYYLPHTTFYIPLTLNLYNKSILVTGASRGIGRAIAVGLAGAGARVAVHYNQRREEALKLVDQIGNGAFAVQAELGQPAECITLFETVIEKTGSLDVLVNNAGIAVEIPMTASVEDWLANWNRTLAVNLTAAQLLSRQAIRHFRERGEGRIINIASRAAFRGDTAEYMAYAASKAGMVALTRSIARAFGKDGIKAFVVAPGFTRTDMAQDFIDTYGEDYASKDIALNRLTEPEDIAPTVVFLASGLADHATGSTIDINAGSYVR